MSDIFDNKETEEVDITTILGDTGKFKTPEELAKAYAHAEKLVQNLKSENDNLEKQAMQAKTVEDLFGMINKASAKTDERHQEQQGSATQTVSKDDIIKGLDEVLDKKLSAMEVKKVEDNNLMKVKQAVEAKFGTRAGAEFDKMAHDAGMSREDLVLLSKRAPAVVLKLLPGAASATASSGTGDINTEHSSSNMTKPLNKDPVYTDLLKRGKFADAVDYRLNKTE